MKNRARLLSMLTAALVIACNEDPSEPPPPDPPVVTGVGQTVVFPGDTLIISGSDFSATEGENTVTFTNPLSATKPYWASAKELRVVVDRDATSGPVTVKTAGGSDQTEAVEVRRNIGDVLVFGGLGDDYVLALPNPTAATRYLLVPHATNNTSPYTEEHAYSIASASVLTTAAGASAAPSPASRASIGPREWFEARRWEEAVRTVERFGAPHSGFDAPALPGAVQPSTRSFYVLKTVVEDQDLPSSYQRITAQRRYSGTRCLVYADIDTLVGALAPGNFTQAHFNAFGQAFDKSIDSTNVSYFGGYSDVDGNDRVILLVSPVVNRLEEDCTPDPPCTCGFYAGFFNPRDLYGSPPVPGGTTNHAEILYLLAADPTGFWDCEFPVTETAAENLGTIPHEHQHLISFSNRLFHQGGATQETWLEEGMAHMAEDLNGDNSSNEARGKLYRADPDTVSIEDNTTTLQQRGGIYLMLRLLADRYGTGILKQIVQSKCTGRACVQNATGLNFYDALAEFLAAQYLSGKGITPDPRYNYTTININDFGPLETTLHAAGVANVTGNVRRSSADFRIFTGVLNQDSRFTFTNSGGRARLRHVVVRIQ